MPYSAFGIDHGYEEVDKAFNPAAIGQKLGQAGGALKRVGQGAASVFRGGGAHAASAGRHSAGGMPKLFGGGAGARAGGAHAGPMKLSNPFGSSGGARKAVGARAAVPGGARKATAAAPATSGTPMYAQLAQKYGINQGGKRKAF
jgi:hypothetical protein